MDIEPGWPFRRDANRREQGLRHICYDIREASCSDDEAPSSGPATRLGTNKMSVCASEEIVSYIVSSDRQSKPVRLWRRPRDSAPIQDKEGYPELFGCNAVHAFLPFFPFLPFFLSSSSLTTKPYGKRYGLFRQNLRRIRRDVLIVVTPNAS